MSHWMSRAVLLCRKQKIGKLLIISTGVSGFHPPGIFERYSLAEKMAQDAASLVKIAHVASLEWMRSGNFGIEVARNRGLDTKNFYSETEALKWLLEEPGRPSSSPTQNDSLSASGPRANSRML
jgi:hypothetical protein